MNEGCNETVRRVGRRWRGGLCNRRDINARGASRRAVLPLSSHDVPTMGAEAIISALCWFTIGGALAANSLNDVSESLYRNLANSGVYASGAPHGAYSFQVPHVAAPNPATFRAIPVKEQNYSFQNMNAYLKDSYGNRFVESNQSPQSIPFKPFPQQFIQLQQLPAHFAQPLPAPSFAGYKQATPQIIVGSHYRLPLQPLQTASPIKQQFGFPQGIYAGNVKGLAPQSTPHSQFYGSAIQLPGPGQSYSVPGGNFHYGSKVIHNQPRPLSLSPTAQPQSTSNEAIYANAQSEEQYHNDDPKLQRVPEASRDESSEEELSELPHHVIHHSDKTEQNVPVRETTVTSFMNGMKTRVNLKTKQPVPLLDISLLEPLTFDNPLVPQVQHFLPKISEATYHKLPEYTQNSATKQKTTQKNKNYDSGSAKVKPKKYAPKKKQRYPLVEVQNSYYDEIPSASTVKPVITVKGTPNESPEFSYEINSPNYKETYKEQAINFNKETKSEPVHISYGTQKHEEPVHYTYVHSSKEPLHIKEVHYEGKGEGPKHIVHKFKFNEPMDEKQHDSEDSDESSEDDRSHHLHKEHREYHNEHGNQNKHHENRNQHRELPKQHENQNKHHENHNKHHENHNKHHENHNKHHENHNQHHEPPKTTLNQKPEHREQGYHHKPSTGSHRNQHDDHHSFKPIQYYTKISSGAFQPVSEYEEEIRISAPIKVNPNQHVQPQSEPRHRNSSPIPQQHSSTPHHDAPHTQQKHHTPTAHVHEKTKSVIIQEETQEQSDDEHLRGMFGREDDKEKDFEKAYKDAAFGFPTYDKSVDFEKNVYNPESYVFSHDHGHDDIKHSPFQQYHDQTDNFPKSSRLSYKDDIDKTKENYFLDYSISKPESMTDHYKNKADYYKLFKQQKPDDESKKIQKTSEKYTAIPYNFYPTQDLSKMKQFFAQFKATTPFVHEFDYTKGVPRDSSAHSTQPYNRYKSNTYFVEPQFQYGFEPISIPRLLDSELAAMASNNSPESEKPGLRKKIYKENFYIKKTSMLDAGHNS